MGASGVPSMRRKSKAARPRLSASSSTARSAWTITRATSTAGARVSAPCAPAYVAPAQTRAAGHCREAADLDRLEQGLALQLEAVREEKRSRQAQESALRSYVPKHPAIGGQGALMAALHPAVHAAIERGSKLALRALLREEAPGVYSLALLSPEFCQRVVEEVQHFAQWRTAAVEAGTTGAAAIPHRTTALAHAGLRGVALELLDRVIRPIAAVLFDDVSCCAALRRSPLTTRPSPHPYVQCGGGSLDWVQGFVAGYAAQPGGEARNLTRTSLVPHTDDSEVTLNVCLGTCAPPMCAALGGAPLTVCGQAASFEAGSSSSAGSAAARRRARPSAPSCSRRDAPCCTAASTSTRCSPSRAATAMR